jgi:Gamma tubulin complex component N-terminal/Gamma tubulin complex component C-terminal
MSRRAATTTSFNGNNNNNSQTSNSTAYAHAATSSNNEQIHHHHEGMIEDAMTRLVGATIGGSSAGGADSDASRAMALCRLILSSHMATNSTSSGISNKRSAMGAATAAPQSPVNSEMLLRRLERSIMQRQQHQADHEGDSDNFENPREAFAKIATGYQQLQQQCQNNNNGNNNGSNINNSADDDGDAWLARNILEVFTALAAGNAATTTSATTKPQRNAAATATSTSTTNGLNRLPNHQENILRNRIQQQQQQRQHSSARNAIDEQVENAFLESLAHEEESLLRDCLYALQGMPGERIQFTMSQGNIRSNTDNINHDHDPSQHHHSSTRRRGDGGGFGVGGMFRLQSAAVAPIATSNNADSQKLEPSAAAASVVPPQFTRFSKLGSSSVGIADALSVCIEAGWLYTRILSYIQRVRQEAAAASSSIAPKRIDQQQPQQQAPEATTRSPGSIARALTSALDVELQSYQQFLAQLEEETTTGMLASSTSTTSSTTTIVGQGYSNLRSLLVSLRTPIQRLKTLAMITDGLEAAAATMTTTSSTLSRRPSGAASGSSCSGPFLLSDLYCHAHGHGDARHGEIVHSLLVAASRPWFEMLYKWTTRGILSDPAHEFFVVSKSSSSSSSSSNNNNKHNGNNDCRFLWSNRYRIDKSMIPMGIIDMDLAEPAFKLGKGINFIRHCLLDGEWSLGDLADRARTCYVYMPPTRTAAARRHEEEGHAMMPGATTWRPPSRTQMTLRSTLSLASQLVNSHILKCLFENHSLMTHLYALKQFLLLGQGDFFSSIMEGLQSEFSSNMIEGRRPGASGMDGIYRHTLAGIAETAMRNTNASNFPPFVLQRLQVEMLNVTTDDSTQNGEKDTKTVWDVFLLEYTVPDPLLPIVHKSAMEDYRMVFVFLFGLNKVEYHLNFMWRQSAVLQHSLQMAAQHKAIQIATSPTYAQANVLLRQIAMTRQVRRRCVRWAVLACLSINGNL